MRVEWRAGRVTVRRYQQIFVLISDEDMVDLTKDYIVMGSASLLRVYEVAKVRYVGTTLPALEMQCLCGPVVCIYTGTEERPVGVESISRHPTAVRHLILSD